MKAIKLFIAVLFLFALSVHAQDSLVLRKIYDEALVNGESYENLRYLCKQIGPRLSGSANAQKSVEWTKSLMDKYGFDKVYLQECMVPHWVRGEKEIGKIINGKTEINVPICALGMSPATPKEGLKAQVIELRDLDELAKLGESVIKGKIVFFNRPFDPRFIETGRAYGTAGDQRFAGPAAAAKYGAVGVIVRSLTESLDNYPHTGTTVFPDGAKQIPCAAISTKAANQLSTLLRLKKLPTIQFYFKQNCQLLPDAKSYNVVGEMTGSEFPNEVITVGGHLDSWDLAEGAHDDGTGVMQAMEVLRVYKALGMKPKHSIRAVMFMNEENGGRGGDKYAELAMKNGEKHIAAIESDGGGFTPRGFTFQDISKKDLKEINENWSGLLRPYLADHLDAGGSGSDIEPLSIFKDAVLIGYRADSQRYFDIHHTPNDVFENVNKRELELGAAAMTSLVYLIDQHGIK
ncbi:MAG: M20/M25/M40 family metallo-hydrolase [Bacteroidetes bacterium]|nr:M20/M25/M40 family metallo-hydrolase [Bacteroidota bacterium]MBU1483262.1 M20/M25/M40 family metallo-hydrolase [Bacteroidota bacterium]MBU1761253.1 M20/M25/M40 family metallo-hydrolase [Bacteroidota bacterium]MBU2046444.1 M20/M25/M40 family metallo-hydrolase [Bacteroidota bacterium]MBU2268843.1 M20/M25/M40 family metallo-hydrolase [Bacteroidota bacterium]